MTDTRSLRARRERLLGRNMSLFYEDPVHLVKGEGVWLWDADGRKYLDCYNNVPHVGHCHPRVVEAICRQASTLNTHTRYLHEGILDYVERLTATFDRSLDTAILTCTGSEANDVALRMAEAVTGRTGVIATDFTYHGNTAAVSQLSTRMPPVGGYGGHVRHVPAPDAYRPLGGEGGQAFATAFAAKVEEAIASLAESPFGFSALIVDPFFANEGFPDLPEDFLAPAVAAVRKAGGLVICDEVQPGFGRTGTHMWGHQKAGIVPHIVTLGKPMGNGHPVGGVVAGAGTLNAFRKAFRYFNTFGGNPVSCAAAMAVLDVLEEEKLQENALEVGAHAREGLRRLGEKHAVIGNVRGSGLFFGAELVLDRAEKTPAPDIATRVINAMRARGVLMGKLGIHQNATKIRPPMPFSRENADLMLSTLDDVLGGFEPMDGIAETLTARAMAAIAHWDLPEQVPDLIKYRENAVFQVRLAWGERAALRLHRPAYHSQAALASELAFMAHLRDRGLAVPQPIPAANGALLVAFGEGPFYADLIGWVEGEPLGETGVPLARAGRDLPAIFRAVGRETALLHGAADAFRQPAGFERPAWDADGLLGEAPFWGRFWDCAALPPEDRADLTALRATLTARLVAIAPGLDHGLIHADIVRENIFVRKGRVAFIDFDDCGFGFRLFDLATTLLRNRREPDYPVLRDALLDGYAAVRPQARAAFPHLPLFLLLRALTYIGWAAARPDLPDNAARLRRYVAEVRALAGEGAG